MITTRVLGDIIVVLYGSYTRDFSRTVSRLILFADSNLSYRYDTTYNSFYQIKKKMYRLKKPYRPFSRQSRRLRFKRYVYAVGNVFKKFICFIVYAREGQELTCKYKYIIRIKFGENTLNQLWYIWLLKVFYLTSSFIKKSTVFDSSRITCYVHSPPPPPPRPSPWRSRETRMFAQRTGPD